MSAVYPAGPADIPANFTDPSSSYRRHAWLAVGGLLLFAVAYFALASWFGWTAWRLFSGLARSGSDDVLITVVAGACAAFLAVFMLKALVFVKHGETADDIELTAAEQPALFEFLNTLAADTGAPRPHRVYVSGRVNAAVFYDLSIANLLFPSRKNLEIGLGLVNVLTLGELKAVLAHEFGHFAQKSMAVGRWVYIAQQIAAHIVGRRDALDVFLTRLSGFDLRIAWVGWLLRLVVWSIRSLVDLLFRVVIIAQRALSREMEFQADLVAVSVTGSDALIHALHKLGAADEAWDKALAFAGNELHENRGVKDLFAIQLRIIENVRTLLGDTTYGAAPQVPATQPEAHRVFKVALAAPPRMWATHPANSDREINAKRRYIRALVDERSAWTLFSDAQSLRERVTAHLVRRADFAPVAPEISLAKLNEQYARGFLNSQYRGAYLGRSVVRHAKTVDELYGVPPLPDRIIEELNTLYPSTLSRDIERLRTLEEERQMLIALREGFLTAPGGVIRHRGTEMSRKALPGAIEAVERELETCAQIVRDHDRRCRTTHVAAANALGEDWAKYLRGLLELLHYADHVEANLLDAQGVLSHTVAVATADGKVSSTELDGIVHSADIAYAALKDVHDAVDQVIPDRTVLKRMRAESWSSVLEKLALPPPDRNNIGDWLNAVGSWIRAASSSLASLRLAALEQLLAAETQIALFTRKGLKPAAAPPASLVPRNYRLLTPGSERPQNAKLNWWDRFQTANGTFPTIARFATAAAIVGAVLLVASGVGSTTVHVFNGLETAVVAHINEQQTTVPAGEHAMLDVGRADHLHILTSTSAGKKIEEFDTDVASGSAQNVYNVASAGALVAWVAGYGSAPQEPERLLGAPRWTTTRADVVFEEAPVSVSLKGGSATRRVLSGIGDGVPERVLSMIEGEAERNAIIAAHARWDESHSRYVYQWLSLAASRPEFAQILNDRLREHPRDVVNLRMQQDASSGAALKTVCEEHRKLATATPDDADLEYLVARCMQHTDEQDRTFLSLQQRWPDNGWLSMAAAYVRAGEGQWQQALQLMERASRKLPSMRDQLAMESARIERVLGGPATDLRKMQARSDYLRMLLAPEINDDTQGDSHRAYASLVHGDLDGALEAHLPAGHQQQRILRLVAASTGAPEEVVQRALALPVEAGIDPDTYLSALALATRYGKDTSALMKLAPQMIQRDVTRTYRAFLAIQEHASREDIEAALNGLEPRLRGQLYVAAAILRGPECPPEWRAAARQLLFAYERPFIR